MRSERGPETLARKAIFITLAVAAFAAIPSGAEAKGFGVRSVAVHGPGLSGPLVVGRLEFLGTSRQDSGNLWEQIFSDYAPTLVPPSSLGPSYLIEYRLGLTLVSGPISWSSVRTSIPTLRAGRLPSRCLTRSGPVRVPLSRYLRGGMHTRRY